MRNKNNFDKDIMEKWQKGSIYWYKQSFKNDSVLNEENHTYATDYKDTYLDSVIFKKIVEDSSVVDQELYEMLSKGAGKETGQYKIFRKWCPPKCRCAASSSLFTLLYASDFKRSNQSKKIKIEEKAFSNSDRKNLPDILKEIGIPNYDMVIGNTRYECKCHEIFDYHKKLKMSTKYKKALKKYFEFTPSEIKDGGYIFSREEIGITGLKHSHFDIKQLICHLLGLRAIQSLNTSEKDIKLQYIFFRPESEKYKKIYSELEEEIKIISNSEGIKKLSEGIGLSFEYITIETGKETGIKF